MRTTKKPLRTYQQRIGNWVIYGLCGIVMLAVLSGCSSSNEFKTVEDSFVRDILLKYPDLKDKPYEVSTVKRVVDGDTFVAANDEKVRLIGVNTPEVHGKVQYYGQEASQFAKDKLTGKKVYLFQDTGSTDRYGRWLRYVFIDQDPQMFNDTLVIEGYANTMTIAPNVMYADHFVKLEREAREKGIGLCGKEQQASGSSSSSKNIHNEESTPASSKEDSASPSSDKESSKAANKNTASGGCKKPDIKGNINAKKEKIYHVPGGAYYEQTKAEEMFCTEDDAKHAGYRPSAR